MRILFTRFPLESIHDGGAEIQLLSLMQGLKSCGHDVEFLGSCPVILEQATHYSLPTTHLDIGPPPVTKFSAISFLWRRHRMSKQLSDAIIPHPNAIFMVSLSEKLLLTEFATAQGINVFWIEHDRIGNWLTRNPWLPALRRASQHATIITVSELSRRMFLDLGFSADRVIAIPNGIDLSRFSQPTVHSPHLRQGFGGQAQLKALHVGCISRLSPEKGVDVLVHALADIPQVSLSIVGRGSDEGYIRTIIAEQERREGTGRIELLPSADLQKFYASIDVLVLPSRDNDPFGLVAAEAMALGIPVLLTDACGIAGYLTHGVDAFIVSANDERAMADGLRQLLDTQLREKLSIAGKKTAHEKFAVERMVDDYEKLIGIS